ncbi:uracil-DNA glycosylase [Ornithinibacillus gellani]|uniref:uracil-DNA glycosylase n=1 Tax=Ornithinibacillus gellani TaxID=2293253 RepID=UPI001CC20D42|nr:uracil-DNA glycosylase [Ornithinibacillus gellani]
MMKLLRETLWKKEVTDMEDACIRLWSEDTVPADEVGCCQCGLINHGSRMIWGEGNPQAPITILLDNPGARENKEGESFVCGTRTALQQGALQAGFHENDLYVTYVLKRRPVKKYDKEKTRAICMRHLQQQLDKHMPGLMICLGNVAVQAFFQSADVDVKGLRGQVYDVQGIKTVVGYHPLAVRRRPNMRKLFDEDWQFYRTIWAEKLGRNQV